MFSIQKINPTKKPIKKKVQHPQKYYSIVQK